MVTKLNSHVVWVNTDDRVRLVLVASDGDSFQLVLRGDGGELVAWAYLTLEEAAELGQALVGLTEGNE